MSEWADKARRFLDLLDAEDGLLYEAVARAGSEAFGVGEDVGEVLAALNISESDAEAIFNNIPDDPAQLVAYLRPRLLNTRD